MEEDKPKSKNDKSDSLSDKAKAMIVDMLFNIFKEEVDKREPNVIRVYSFRPISDYLYNELFFSYLSCSPVTSFNDPLDCLLFPLLIRDIAEYEKHGFKSVLMEQIRKTAENLRVRCFVSENTTEADVTTNPLMWAHYADSHKGILLCYEIPEIVENDSDKISFFCKVDYTNSIKNLVPEDINLIKMITTKNKAWEYENEIRLIHYSKLSEEQYPEIKIKKSYLKKIYFGLHTSEMDKLRIEQFTEYYPDLELFDTLIDPDDLLHFKNYPHKIDENNILHYTYSRPGSDFSWAVDPENVEETQKKMYLVLMENGFRGGVEDLIMTTNSLEEVLQEYDKLSDQGKKYMILYVALYKKDKSKLTWDPDTMEDLHALVKETISIYYESRRNIHAVREHLGITEYFMMSTEKD